MLSPLPDVDTTSRKFKEYAAKLVDRHDLRRAQEQVRVISGILAQNETHGLRARPRTRPRTGRPPRWTSMPYDLCAWTASARRPPGRRGRQLCSFTARVAGSLRRDPGFAAGPGRVETARPHLRRRRTPRLVR